MVKDVLRGIVIAICAAIIIEFVILFVQLIMPNSLLDGNEIIVFSLTCVVGYIVYNFLPEEDETKFESKLEP